MCGTGFLIRRVLHRTQEILFFEAAAPKSANWQTDRIGSGPSKPIKRRQDQPAPGSSRRQDAAPTRHTLLTRGDSMYKPNTIGAVLLSLNFGVEDLKPFSALLHPDAPAVKRTRRVLAFGSLLYRRFVRNHGNVSAREDDFHVGK